MHQSWGILADHHPLIKLLYLLCFFYPIFFIFSYVLSSQDKTTDKDTQTSLHR